MKTSNRIIFILTLAFASVLFPQQRMLPQKDDESKLIENGLQFERLQMFEKAEEIYLSILQKNPSNSRAIIHLKNLYKRTGWYVQLENLLHKQIELFPNDIPMQVDYGEVFFLRGDTEKALSHWSSLIERWKGSEQLYRNILQMYMMHGFDAEAIALVEKGRNDFANPTLFAMEIAAIHAKNQKYVQAVSEYLNFAKQNPRSKALVQRELFRLSDNPLSIASIDSVFQTFLPEGNSIVKELYVDILFKLSRYNELAQIFSTGDLKIEEDVREWLTLARDLGKEGETNLAIDLIQKIVDALPTVSMSNRFKNSDQFYSETIFTIGETIESLATQKIKSPSLTEQYGVNIFFSSIPSGEGNFDHALLERSIAIYDSLVTALPLSDLSPQALFRLGRINHDVFGDTDKALTLFTTVVENSKNSELTMSAILNIADVLVEKGEFDQALHHIRQAKILPIFSSSKVMFTMKEIQILLLTSQLDSLNQQLQSLISLLDSTDPVFNDLLELKLFLEENNPPTSQSSKDAFQLFLLGERALKQKKISEAENYFHEIETNYPHSPVYDDALFQRAKINVALQNNVLALTLFTLVEKTSLKDFAIVAMAELYEQLPDRKEQAIQEYYRLLEENPESILSEPVRLKIRELTKETRFTP